MNRNKYEPFMILNLSFEREMCVFIQCPYQLIFNQYFVLKVITFESLRNLRFMTVDIILSENNCIVLWLQKLYMLNVKHSENSERCKEESKKKSFCSTITAHLLVRLLSHLRISVNECVCMLILALLCVLLLTHVLSLFLAPYKYKS